MATKTPTNVEATKGGVVELRDVARRPPNGITEPVKAGIHIKPHLITPVVWVCLGCICATTGVALWKIIFGNDPSPYPYAMATAGMLGSFLLLGVFFGKNGKAGALTISG